MRLLPAKRRTRVALLLALATAIAMTWAWSYRPWEAHYRGRPTSWWAQYLLACYEKEPLFPPTMLKPKIPSQPLPLVWLRDWSTRMGIYHEVTLEDAQNLFNEDPAATPVFLELLRHPDETVRMMAVFNECNNLELVRAQIAALIDLSLHSSKASARAAAIVTLQSYHQTHPEAFDAEVRQSVISALVESLRDEYDLARMNAASALREIDPVAARQAGVPVPDS